MSLRQRKISLFAHPLTTRQALSNLLDMWRQNRDLPIAVVGPRGEMERFTKSIRVTLSKERAKQGAKAHYGFTQSDPFPYTEAGIKGEAVILRFRLTELQTIRNNLDAFDNVVVDTQTIQ